MNRANDTTQFIVRGDGNVGVNTDFTGSQTWRSGQILEIFGGGGNVTGELHLGANRSDANQSVGSVNFFDNGQDTSHKQIAVIEADKAGSTSNKRGGDLRFYTKPDNVASPTERLRITAAGTAEFYGGEGGTDAIKVQSEGGGVGLYFSNFQGITDTGDSTRLGVGKNDNALIWMNASASQVGCLAYGTTDAVPLVFSTANTERFRITSNGDWKAASFDNTYACMYRALSNASTSNMMNSSGTMIFSSATFSMGNSNVYNTSNGKYTAPIRGLYLFNFNGLLDDSFNSGSIFVKAKVDGSLTDIFYIYESAQSGYYHHVSGSHVIALNAGQTHEFHANAGGFHISNETNFSACLIQAY